MRLFLTLAPGGDGWVCTASAAETVWSFDFGQGIGDECAVGSSAEGAMRDKDGFDEAVEEQLDALPEEEPASGQYCLTPPTLHTETVYERPYVETFNINNHMDKLTALTVGSSILIGGALSMWRRNY